MDFLNSCIKYMVKQPEIWRKMRKHLKLKQASKALFSIAVTLLGIVTLVMNKA